MRHRKKTSQLATDTKHRKAMLRSLLRNLFTHGKIVTTQAKAKETKRLADKLISKAKKDDLATARKLHQFFGKRDVVSTLLKRIAPQFKERKSGFVRIKKLLKRRGDNTQLYEISLVKEVENLGSLKKPKAKASVKKTASASKKAKPAKSASPADQPAAEKPAVKKTKKA